MAKCQGKTKAGSPCKKDAREGFTTCSQHSDQEVQLQPSQPEVVDPYQAYQDWEDREIVFERDKKFQVTRRFSKPSRREPGTVEGWIRYRTPLVGRPERDIAVTNRDQRMKTGKLPYYLLPKGKELQGVELVSNFPGAPDENTLCEFCSQPLYRNTGHLYSYLRDVLEAIIRNVTPADQVHWRKQHQECWQFKRDWLTPFREVAINAITEVRIGGSSNRELESKLVAETVEDWKRKGEGLLRYLAKRRVPKARVDFFRQQIEAQIEEVLS